MTQLRMPVDSAGGGDRPEYLTIAEAAAEVRVCERTVRRAIDNGRLRAGCVRGSAAERGAWRIRRDDLERWLYEDGGS